MFARILRVAALASVVALAGCLGADTPEEQIKSIEEKMAKNLPMTDKQSEEFKAHLAKGREELAAGNKEAAGEALSKALDILKIAEDTALYNKAD